MAAETTIQSFAEYLGRIEEHLTQGLVLFRGQPRDQSLLPRIARLRFRGLGGTDSQAAERRMLAEFKRQSLPFLPRPYDNDWDWLALAQHHGLATRLLDWTTNPLASLWFVVNRPPTTDRQGVVWVFPVPSEDIVTAEMIAGRSAAPFDGPQRTQVFQPNLITQRIFAQCGWFTVHKPRGRDGEFVPLERQRTYGRRLVKLLIPPRLFADLRARLDRLGVNHATMFPDLDGVGRHILWLHSFMDDEETSGKLRSSTAMPVKKARSRGSRGTGRKSETGR